jgi:hypothetical protein
MLNVAKEKFTSFYYRGREEDEPEHELQLHLELHIHTWSPVKSIPQNVLEKMVTGMLEHPQL